MEEKSNTCNSVVKILNSAQTLSDDVGQISAALQKMINIRWHKSLKPRNFVGCTVSWMLDYNGSFIQFIHFPHIYCVVVVVAVFCSVAKYCQLTVSHACDKVLWSLNFTPVRPFRSGITLCFLILETNNTTNIFETGYTSALCQSVRSLQVRFLRPCKKKEIISCV